MFKLKIFCWLKMQFLTWRNHKFWNKKKSNRTAELIQTFGCEIMSNWDEASLIKSRSWCSQRLTIKIYHLQTKSRKEFLNSKRHNEQSGGSLLMNEHRWSKCRQSGYYNFSRCQYGMPFHSVFVSLAMKKMK